MTSYTLADRYYITSYKILLLVYNFVCAYLAFKLIYSDYLNSFMPNLIFDNARAGYDNYGRNMGSLFVSLIFIDVQRRLFIRVETSHKMNTLCMANITLVSAFLLSYYTKPVTLGSITLLLVFVVAFALTFIAYKLKHLPGYTQEELHSFKLQNANIKQNKPAQIQNVQLEQQREQTKIQNNIKQESHPNDYVIHYKAEKTNKTFSNIQGMDELKNRLLDAGREITIRTNIAPRNGILLFGPPGNGKTYIAECFAGELNLPLISISYGDVVSHWVGETTKNVKKIFDDAIRQAPCALFLDEIESFIESRSTASNNNETNKTTNTILTEIVKLRAHGVVFIGATNYIEKLDAAAIREGRFDFKIEITPPDSLARLNLLFQSICKFTPRIQYDEDSLIRISDRWVGFSVKRILSVGEEIASMHKEQEIDLIDNDVLNSAMRRLQGRKGKLPENTKSLNDMYFNEELGKSLKSIAKRLKEAMKIEDFGGSVPNGILFHGPAGTGKTETARAIAKDTGYAFLSTTANDLCANRSAIDDLIKEASDIRPCIVFIDEADDILANRNYSNMASITNKLLTVMDGSEGKIPDILYIAATNNPDNIDPAALRGGRFTEKLYFSYPNYDVVAQFASDWMTNSKAKFSHELTGEKVADLLDAGNISIANIVAVLQESVNQMLGNSDFEGKMIVSKSDIKSAKNIILS